MTRTLLRWHLWVWCVLTPALAALLVLALLDRPVLPVPQELPAYAAPPVAESR